MRKIIVALVMGTMLAAGVASAAPITDLQNGETQVGYQHYDMNSDVKSDSVYLEGAVSDKVVLGIERSGYAYRYSDMEMTDVYAQYKLDPNVRLIVGNRNYDGGSNKMFAGIGGHASLAPKLDGYASVTGSSIATEWHAGLTYNMDGQNAIQLGYKSYKQDNDGTLDGIGLGFSHKF